LRDKVKDLKIIWVETICSEEGVKDNMARSIKSGNPDYEGIDFETALNDLGSRVQNLTKSYQEVSEENDGEGT